MGLEWQCLSFDVPPQSLPAAIAGIDVLRFAGALIASPHHTAVSALLKPAAADAPTPCPALPCPDWIDGLDRGKQGELIGCNFIGDAFGELLQAHQQKIGQPLGHCIYLGDAESFEALVAPYRQHLPVSCFVLGATGLQLWPANVQQATPQTQAASEDAVHGHLPTNSSGATVEICCGEQAGPADESSSADPQHPPASETENPLTQPVLLIRPRPDSSVGKKAATKAKSNPLGESALESILEQLHPDSLRMDLAPVGASWPVFRGPGDASAGIVAPLDLEIGRVAAAIKRWTGRDADRDILAEAIEEYLEI